MESNQNFNNNDDSEEIISVKDSVDSEDILSVKDTAYSSDTENNASFKDGEYYSDSATDNISDKKTAEKESFNAQKPEEIYNHFYEILKNAKANNELKKVYDEEKAKLRKDLAESNSKEEMINVKRRNFLLNKAYKALGGKIRGQVYKDIIFAIIGAILILVLLPLVIKYDGVQLIIANAEYKNSLYKNASHRYMRLTKKDKPNAVAQNMLGIMNERGHGFEKDESKAVEWYRKSAENGYAEAQNNLANMYLYGKGGLLQSYSEAADWHEKAAAQGLAAAQYELATAYYSGVGLPEDEGKAIELLEKSAGQGYEKAKEKLKLIENLKK